MIVSCYHMALYCDGLKGKHDGPWIDANDVTRGRFPIDFTGRTFSECKREAMGLGWKFLKRGGEEFVFCPDCVQGRAT